jgi:hypothetical protein
MYGKLEKVAPVFDSFEARAEALDRLLENQDFKNLIMEEYINRFVLANGINLTMYPEDVQKDVDEGLKARSALHRFLSSVLDDREVAQQQKLEAKASEVVSED